MEHSGRVYIVEDEALIAMELADRLTALGYEHCGTSMSGEDALPKIMATAPDLVLMDVRLSGAQSGLETAALLRKQSDTAVVFLTAYSSPEYLTAAGEAASFGYLVKPFDERSLHATLQTALCKHRLERELKAANEQLEARIEARTASLDTLRRLHEKFIAQGESPDGWHALVGEVAHCVGVDRAFIGEMAHEGNDTTRLRLDAVFGFDTPAASGMRFTPVWNDQTAEELRALVDNAIRARLPKVGTLTLHALAVDEREDRGSVELRIVVIPILAEGVPVGIVGVEWRDSAQEPILPTDLRLVLTTCGALLHARDTERRRRAAELSLRVLNANLESEVERRATALLESEHRFGDLVENINDGLVRYDLEGRLVYANAKFREWFGLSATDTLGQSIQEFVAPEWRESIRRRHASRVRGEQLSEQSDYEGIGADGRRFSIDARVSLVLTDGRVVGTQSLLRDVTEAKKIEQILRLLSVELASLTGSLYYDRLLMRLTEVIPCDVSFILRDMGSSWRTVAWTDRADSRVDRALPHFGPMEQAELLGDDFRAVAEYAPSDESADRRLTQLRIAAFATIPLVTHNGRPIGYLGVMSRTAIPNSFSLESVMKLVAVVLAGEMMSERDARLLHDLVEFSPDAIVISNADGVIERVNQRTEKLFGWTRDELVGQTVDMLVPAAHRGAHPAHRRQFMHQASPRQMGAGNASLLANRKNGETFPVEISLSPLETDDGILVAAAIRDITERQLLEKQVNRRQRLDAVGALAGGIAHDLNNSLSPILMAVELLRTESPKSSALLDTLELSSRRAAAMVRQLLTFSKGTEGARFPLSVAALVDEMEKIILLTFPKSVRFIHHVPRGLPAVLGDVTQLHQMLLNLCVNARDAMPEGGTLTVEAMVDIITANDTRLRRAPESRAGRYVAIRVRDTGEGIPAGTIDRLFEPFFTTKGPDKGTGLGLSTVLGIVKGHGGFVLVDSTPSQGATFTVFLPMTTEASSTILPSARVERFVGHGETILYVDDDVGLRDVGSAILRTLNLTPLLASDGEDGLRRVAEHSSALRAIICDLNMPTMDGLAFCRAARGILPDVPIIVTSGLLTAKARAEFEALGVSHFVDKPYSLGEIELALRDLLAPTFTAE